MEEKEKCACKEGGVCACGENCKCKSRDMEISLVIIDFLLDGGEKILPAISKRVVVEKTTIESIRRSIIDGEDIDFNYVLRNFWPAFINPGFREYIRERKDNIDINDIDNFLSKKIEELLSC